MSTVLSKSLSLLRLYVSNARTWSSGTSCGTDTASEDRSLCFPNIANDVLGELLSLAVPHHDGICCGVSMEDVRPICEFSSFAVVAAADEAVRVNKLDVGLPLLGELGPLALRLDAMSPQTLSWSIL